MDAFDITLVSSHCVALKLPLYLTNDTPERLLLFIGGHLHGGYRITRAF